MGRHLTVSPGLRPTSIPSGVLIHPTVWPQYSNITDRTFVITVACHGANSDLQWSPKKPALIVAKSCVFG